MIDAERLEQLRRAAHAGDWALAGEAYIELTLAARNAADQFRVEGLAPYVRLRDAAGVLAVIRALKRIGRERSSVLDRGGRLGAVN